MAKPLRETLVIQFTAGDGGDGLCDYLVIFNELIAASLNQQFHQIESRSFVAIRKPVIRNDSVNQRRRLLMDESVVAMVRAG